MQIRTGKTAVKKVLGSLPLTAELYWLLRQQGKPLSKSFSLQRIRRRLPEWVAEAQAALAASPDTVVPPHPEVLFRKVFMFTTLRYWVEHSTLLSLALAGQGCQVTLAYLPVNDWRVRLNRFDLRRQNAYTRDVLRPAGSLIRTVSLLDIKTAGQSLPPQLAEAIQEVSIRDVQYTLQVEEVDRESELYRLRLECNTQAALAALSWLGAQRPDVVLTPNGSILEMGAIYQVARFLSIPVVTYEFGEQRGRIWLAQDDEVMLQHTDELWQAWKDQPLAESEWEQIRALYASRRSGNLWENFSRRWQGSPAQGGEITRQALGLDAGSESGTPSRPVVLLAANVIGDSLTLGRQVFSRDMTEWLQRTLRYFAQRPDVQLIVRIHPGERYTKGPSVADIVKGVLPDLPDGKDSSARSYSSANIHLVAAGDPLNTYDLIDIADIGLVYTTTVGMEMAMSGVPTIVAGQTHYRSKGFTLDPNDWEEYFRLLNLTIDAVRKYSSAEYNYSTRKYSSARKHSLGGRILPEGLFRSDSDAQSPAEEYFRADFPPDPRIASNIAWQYAYRFFFDYPLPFPWHMLYFFDELEEWPLSRVLSSPSRETYKETFQVLLGERRQYKAGAGAGDVAPGGTLSSPSVSQEAPGVLTATAHNAELPSGSTLPLPNLEGS